MKSSVLTLYAISLLFCSIVLATPAVGQQSDSMREFHEWESRRDALNRVAEARRPSAVSRRGTVTPQRREDFKRIQALNNELEQAASQGGALDLRFITRATSEMNKRAKRLMVSLALSEPQGQPQRIRTQTEVEPDQLKSSLLTLRELITRFMNNPAFRSSHVVNVQMMAQAGHDLDEIIELSSQVKECSERLVKAADAASNKLVQPNAHLK